MYKIGDFSKIVDIPVRTLRYYAEYGVLVPSEVDPFTGYKYYSEDNIVECELIKLLKSLDFTLEEIIKYKSNITEEVIENKKKEIETRIAILKTKYKKLCCVEDAIRNNKEIKEKRVLKRVYERRNDYKSA
jgi:DNA-binding transcriptional MerR regulator